MADITYVYGDGASFRDGLFGAWAWCHVDAKDERVAEAAGILHRDEFDRDMVSSHYMEVLALIQGIEALPDRWSGTLRSDASSALKALSGQALGKLPLSWSTRIRVARRRLGTLTLEWVRGHPRMCDLANGHKFGVPVSEHNVYVDRRCHEESVRWLRNEVEIHEPIKGSWTWG